MQTTVIPIGLCQELDKVSHQFLRGSTVYSWRIHNVNWDIICLPKERVSLGLKLTKLVN